MAVSLGSSSIPTIGVLLELGGFAVAGAAALMGWVRAACHCGLVDRSAVHCGFWLQMSISFK